MLATKEKEKKNKKGKEEEQREKTSQSIRLVNITVRVPQFPVLFHRERSLCQAARGSSENTTASPDWSGCLLSFPKGKLTVGTYLPPTPRLHPTRPASAENWTHANLLTAEQ